MELLYEGLYLLLVLVCISYFMHIHSRSNITMQFLPLSDSLLPSVSIIVPTLKESKNIEKCLRSLVNLDYPQEKLEIIVSDGGSEDGTPELAKQYIDNVIVDSTLPKYWIGKSYGCHIGYKESKGDILLFTDADTVHEPNSLRFAVYILLGSKSSLVSMLPYQKSKKWYEFLTGFYYFLSYLAGGPMEYITDVTKKESYMASGQYMLFTRQGYEAIGGHIAVKSEIIEDIALAKLCKDRGEKILFMKPSKLVTTRMYPDGFMSLFYGFHKVIWEGLNTFPLHRIFFIVLWLLYSIIAPYIMLLALVTTSIDFIGIELLYNIALYFAFTAIYFTFWHKRGDGNFFFYFFYPLAMIITITIIVNSILHGVLKKPFNWRGRQYSGVDRESTEKQHID